MSIRWSHRVNSESLEASRQRLNLIGHRLYFKWVRSMNESPVSSKKIINHFHGAAKLSHFYQGERLYESHITRFELIVTAEESLSISFFIFYLESDFDFCWMFHDLTSAEQPGWFGVSILSRKAAFSADGVFSKTFSMLLIAHRCVTLMRRIFPSWDFRSFFWLKTSLFA